MKSMCSWSKICVDTRLLCLCEKYEIAYLQELYKTKAVEPQQWIELYDDLQAKIEGNRITIPEDKVVDPDAKQWLLDRLQARRDDEKWVQLNYSDYFV